MNVREYLMSKYQTDTPTSMLLCEQRALGVRLSAGWLNRYGSQVITPEIEARLRSALKKNNSPSARLGLDVLDRKPAVRTNREIAQQIKQSRKRQRDLINIVYLDCPYTQKDEAKALGARWDTEEKLWYVPEGIDLMPFQRWIPDFYKMSLMQMPDGSVHH